MKKACRVRKQRMLLAVWNPPFRLQGQKKKVILILPFLEILRACQRRCARGIFSAVRENMERPVDKT